MFKLKPGPNLVSSSSPSQQQQQPSSPPPPQQQQQQSNKDANIGDNEGRDIKKKLLFVPCRRKQEQSHKLPFKKRAQHIPSPLMFSSPPVEAMPTQQTMPSPEPSSSPQLLPPLQQHQTKQPEKKEEEKQQYNITHANERLENSPSKPPAKSQKLFTFKLNLTKVKRQPQQNHHHQNGTVNDLQKEAVENKVKSPENSPQKQTSENCEKREECEKKSEEKEEEEEEEESVISASSPLWKRYSVLSSEVEETFVLLERVEAELSDLNKDINTTTTTNITQ